MVALLLLAVAMPVPVWTTHGLTHRVAGKDSVCVCRAVSGADTFYAYMLPAAQTRIDLSDLNEAGWAAGRPKLRGGHVQVQTTWGPADEWRPAIVITERPLVVLPDFATRIIVTGATGCYRVWYGQWEWRAE